MGIGFRPAKGQAAAGELPFPAAFQRGHEDSGGTERQVYPNAAGAFVYPGFEDLEFSKAQVELLAESFRSVRKPLEACPSEAKEAVSLA